MIDADLLRDGEILQRLFYNFFLINKNLDINLRLRLIQLAFKLGIFLAKDAVFILESGVALLKLFHVDHILAHFDDITLHVGDGLMLLLLRLYYLLGYFDWL